MVVVAVAEGQLRGTEETLTSGGTYYSFKGIPYAQPPLGTLRFKDPQPPNPWEGVRDASNHGGICRQLDPMTQQEAPGSNEDCLYLNVYTRSTNPHSKTPVMFWVHGGAFKMGSGDSSFYGPNFILKHNVVLVTINYRIEAFGFLSLDTPEVPGNAGLKDQVAALRWVKENIEKFGGDPDDVTIFGESAGGASVALLLVSPLTKGLFTKAIVQSGSNIADWSFLENPRDNAFKLGKTLGKETTDVGELLDFLQNIPASQLVNCTEKVRQSGDLKSSFLFLPVVEKEFVQPGLLTKNPIETLTSGDIPDIPLTIGVTSGEGVLMLQEDLRKLETINENPGSLVPREIRSKLTPEETIRVGKKIREYYFKGSYVSEDTIPQLVDLKSDLNFIYPVYRLARFFANRNSSPVYFYYFDYIGQRAFLDSMFKGKYAQQLPLASHGAELSYLFEVRRLPPVETNSPTAAFIDKLTTLWTNFAKKGSPTPDGKLGVKWERFSPELRNYLTIDEQLAAKRNFLEERMLFWDNLYQNYDLPI